MDLNYSSAAVLGGIQGQLGSIIKNYFDLKKHKITAKYKAVESIRQIKYKPFVWLQSICAIIIISYVCLIPFFASYFGIPIEMAYVETNGVLKAAFTGSQSISWNDIHGLPIGPCHVYLSSAACFYLFGNKGR